MTPASSAFAQLPPALSLHSVSKSFGKTRVVHKLELSVPRGSSMALIGPNGAGKSTVFNLISGRHTPDAGEIRLHGQRIDGKPPHRIHRLGLSRSFQVSELFGHLTVFDHLRCATLSRLGYGHVFWRAFSGLRDVERAAVQVMEQIGLGTRRDVPARLLTYAEQRLLELGITIAGDADVILLDEPTAGMGQAETRQFIELIRRVTRGKTVVTVEHDMDVVFELAETVAVLVQGALLAMGPPQAMRDDPRVQQAYLGNPAAISEPL